MKALLACSLVCLPALVHSSEPVSFVPLAENPVIVPGSTSWNVDSAWFPSVAENNGILYMTQMGVTVPFGVATGFATSTDAIHWTITDGGPAMAGDGTGFDAGQVSGGYLVPGPGEEWVMYYGGQPVTTLPGPTGTQIGRAVASGPDGPWTRAENPVLTTGSSGEWDADFVVPMAVLETDTGYMMYYSGDANFFNSGSGVGLATSADGVAWTKHDDPATTQPPYAESDPVLTNGEAGSWDSFSAEFGTVRRTPDGWEMYYSGTIDLFSSAIGYATSPDGVTWTKHMSNPVYAPSADPVASVLVEVPTVFEFAGATWMYHDYGAFGAGIGGAVSDADGDAVGDHQDNCLLAVNNDQRDTNMDGFGNVCDADLNDDLAINFFDLGVIKAAFFSEPESINWNADADLDGDDLVGFSDLVLMKQNFFGQPGPSAVTGEVGPAIVLE